VVNAIADYLRLWGMNKKLTLSICAVACYVCVPAIALADVHGVVVDVPSGDTVTISAAGHSFRLQLSKVDAPHPEQPYGVEAWQSLAQLCQGKHASIDELVLRRERRILARVRCAGIDVNAEQVRRGLAWVVSGDAEAGSPLYELERQARAAPRGLWAQAQPVPPWKWPLQE
jgi:endonuclease YncB( thermonuclease family)